MAKTILLRHISLPFTDEMHATDCRSISPQCTFNCQAEQAVVVFDTIQHTKLTLCFS